MSKFILEPFVEHQTDKDEFYVAIYSKMNHDIILFYEHGGVDVGDIDEKVNFFVNRLILKFSTNLGQTIISSYKT